MFNWIVCELGTIKLCWLMFTNQIYIIYMNKSDLALNNLQWLICHKTNQTKPNQPPKKIWWMKYSYYLSSIKLRKVQEYIGSNGMTKQQR